jgi:hypothetical protein
MAVAAIAVLALACAGGSRREAGPVDAGQAPDSGSALTQSATVAPSPTPTPDYAAVCRDLAGGRPCYTGPLFDAHLHPGWSIQGDLAQPDLLRSLDRDLVSPALLLRSLDRDGLMAAMVFWGTPGPLRDSSALQRARARADFARGRVVSMLLPDLGPMTAPVTPIPGAVTRWLEDYPSGAELEALLRANLPPQGPFAGIGEVAMYFPALQALTLGSPELQSVFTVVNQARGIVMVHIRDSRQRSPTTATEVEEALRRHPDATFILHGQLDIYDLVEPLVARYPNLFYSFDFPSWTALSPRLREGLRCCLTKETFLADYALRGLDFVVDQGLREVVARIALHPDRVMWGTDRFLTWHFDAEVSALIMAISRVLIARLPREQQELFAYGNALRIMGKYLR